MALYKRKIYDPGQFRHRVAFYKQVSEPDESGGVNVVEEGFFSTFAVRVDIREGSQLAIAAGASYLNEDRWYVIRSRSWVYPDKPQVLKCDGNTYTIAAIVELNQPVDYWKLLCIKST